MLTPEYLESLPEPVVKLWQQVEDDILRDIARHIGKMDGMTETADFQLWRLEEIRTLRKSVTEILAKYSGKTEQEIRNLLQTAGKIALDDDDAVYAAAGYQPGPINDSVALLNLLNAGYAQTMGTWDNLTATTANTVTREFEHALDRAWLQVSSGAFDYKTAIKRAVDGLAQHMPGVTYPSGHHDTLEVAVRRAVLTGVNQTASKLQLARMDEFAWDWVEVSAHSGARPEHAAWQGKLYHRGGAAVYQGKRYEDFETATGYGTGAGLCGWNCRHTFFASSPDNPPAWSPEELAALSEKTINYNGEKYTKYEISQMQRDLERKVRSAKRKYMAETEAGVDATRAAVELKTRREELNRFIAETHGRMDSSRTSVSGFGHSAAAKATAAANRQKRYGGVPAQVERVWVAEFGAKGSSDFLKEEVEDAGTKQYAVNWKAIRSEEYERKFSKVTSNEIVNQSAYNHAKWMLRHRNGVNTEELYVLNLDTGEEILKVLDQHYPGAIKRTRHIDKVLREANKDRIKLLFMHNHPKGNPPSRTDINTLMEYPGSLGLTIGYDGNVYLYSAPNKNISEFDYAVAMRKYKDYTEITGEEKGLESLVGEYDFKFSKL